MKNTDGNNDLLNSLNNLISNSAMLNNNFNKLQNNSNESISNGDYHVFKFDINKYHNKNDSTYKFTVNNTTKETQLNENTNNLNNLNFQHAKINSEIRVKNNSVNKNTGSPQTSNFKNFIIKNSDNLELYNKLSLLLNKTEIFINSNILNK